jgi:hypothetical protein
VPDLQAGHQERPQQPPAAAEDGMAPGSCKGMGW